MTCFLPGLCLFPAWAEGFLDRGEMAVYRTLAHKAWLNNRKIPVSEWTSDALKDDIMSRTEGLSASFRHQINRCGFTLRTGHHVDTGVSYSRYKN